MALDRLFKDDMPPLDGSVKHTGSLVFDCEKNGKKFFVSYLPDKVVLYGDFGNQIFDSKKIVMKRNRDTGYKWSLTSSLFDAATLHTHGMADERFFREAMETLLTQKLIDEKQFRELDIFIAECDCPPQKIRMKLERMGYSQRIANALVRPVKEPELLSTVEAMDFFLDNAPMSFINEELGHQYAR